MKTRDTNRIIEAQEVGRALHLYSLEFGQGPGNFNVSTGFVCETSGEDESGQDYDQVIGQLVNTGYLSQIPHNDGNSEYCYQDDGEGNTAFSVPLEIISIPSSGCGQSVYGTNGEVNIFTGSTEESLPQYEPFDATMAPDEVLYLVNEACEVDYEHDAVDCNFPNSDGQYLVDWPNPDGLSYESWFETPVFTDYGWIEYVTAVFEHYQINDVKCVGTNYCSCVEY
jgi:hypothetical protein